MKFGITLFLVLFTFLACWLKIIPILWGAFFLVIEISLIVIGITCIQTNFFIKGFHKLKTDGKKEIAITFDDGPNPDFTLRVLKLLKKYNCKATFFCVGKNLKLYPEIAKTIVADGHAIANHSYTHSQYIDFKLSSGWTEELRLTQEEIAKITGEKKSIFRPPYGITTPHLAHAVKKMNLTVVGWSVRPYDTLSQPIKIITDKIKNKTKNGSILLLHDSHSRTIPILEIIIPYFLSLGYQFVTINETSDLKG
ncbi:polysaccharide deacetylase family protein [Apibacter raozihei]|uniref:polysaccharide deacetylase family protein n=1 Tax=Apibacter raozihei TaxID=2500547 RepID=UPI000FE3F510|nr:polysaccharide deacetylase family protein [Apibacter raozihei]